MERRQFPRVGHFVATILPGHVFFLHANWKHILSYFSNKNEPTLKRSKCRVIDYNYYSVESSQVLLDQNQMYRLHCYSLPLSMSMMITTSFYPLGPLLKITSSVILSTLGTQLDQYGRSVYYSDKLSGPIFTKTAQKLAFDSTKRSPSEDIKFSIFGLRYNHFTSNL